MFNLGSHQPFLQLDMVFCNFIMKTQAIVLLAIICLASSAGFQKTRQLRGLSAEPEGRGEIRMWNMMAGRCEDSCPAGCAGECAADKVFTDGMSDLCNTCQDYWNGSEYPRY